MATETVLQSTASYSSPASVLASSAEQEDSGQDDVVKRLLPAMDSVQRLMRHQNAHCVCLLRKESPGEFKAIEVVGQFHEALNDRLTEIANSALNVPRLQSRLIIAGQRYLVLSLAIRGQRSQVLMALFPVTSGKDCQEDLALRSRELEITAAMLAIEQLTLLVNQLLESPQVTAAPPSHPPQSAPSVWQSVRLAVAPLVATYLAPYRSEPKAYFLAACGATLLGLIPWPHVIRCEVTCEPALRRFVAAPFDAKLSKSYVKAGDVVTQGQVLALLDGGELRSQLASLNAKLSQASQRQTAAMNGRDASKAGLEKLEVQYLRQEVELLETRQHDLDVRAPIAGVVVSGDLERVEGAPLKTGDTMFEVAPLGRLVVEIAIPESDISYAAQGMPVSILLDAARGQRHSSTLKQIHPRSELLKQHSVFIATADIDNRGTLLRPGMNGTAKIDAGWRPIAWVIFHKPYETLRQWIGW